MEGQWRAVYWIFLHWIFWPNSISARQSVRSGRCKRTWPAVQHWRRAPHRRSLAAAGHSEGAERRLEGAELAAQWRARFAPTWGPVTVVGAAKGVQRAQKWAAGWTRAERLAQAARSKQLAARECTCAQGQQCFGARCASRTRLGPIREQSTAARGRLHNERPRERKWAKNSPQLAASSRPASRHLLLLLLLLAPPIGNPRPPGTSAGGPTLVQQCHARNHPHRQRQQQAQ